MMKALLQILFWFLIEILCLRSGFVYLCQSGTQAFFRILCAIKESPLLIWFDFGLFLPLRSWIKVRAFCNLQIFCSHKHILIILQVLDTWKAHFKLAYMRTHRSSLFIHKNITRGILIGWSNWFIIKIGILDLHTFLRFLCSYLAIS